MERRLSAVLAADVVGYSRLVGTDEEGTLRRVAAVLKDVVGPKLAEHRGRLIKTTGDGLLAEFPSPVEAVRSAGEIQRAMIELNSRPSAIGPIEFRIGINLGDVVAEAGDIYGDGVNVAARLEGLAEPGGICVSGMVRDLVHDKLPIAFSDAGEQLVKNIARPVRVYKLSREAISALPLTDFVVAGKPTARWLRVGMAAAAAALLVAVGLWRADLLWPGREGVLRQNEQTDPPRLSIAVLPFANLSNDPGQDYFVDGITDDLITDLSRISGSFVIARNSVFTYKGKAVDARQVGKELGVRYILEGSVQRNESGARVNAELVDAKTGNQIWADRFDYALSNLFELQNQITGRIARSLDLEVIEAESRRGLEERPDDPDAVDLTMRGWALFNKPRARENNVEARKLFEAALRKEPQKVDATGGLGDDRRQRRYQLLVRQAR